MYSQNFEKYHDVTHPTTQSLMRGRSHKQKMGEEHSTRISPRQVLVEVIFRILVKTNKKSVKERLWTEVENGKDFSFLKNLRVGGWNLRVDEEGEHMEWNWRRSSCNSEVKNDDRIAILMILLPYPFKYDSLPLLQLVYVIYWVYYEPGTVLGPRRTTMNKTEHSQELEWSREENTREKFLTEINSYNYKSCKENTAE